MNIILLTLLALPFSYIPVINFGDIAGLHAHLSLIYLLVVASVILSTPRIIHQWSSIWRLWPMRLLLAFNLYQTIAILWSSNHLRGLYSAAFVWLMTGFIATLIVWYPSLSSKTHRKTWQKGLRIVACVVGVWALLQIFLDAFGFTTLSLLPSNYQSGVFGVARPTGFALEPQFFASILLIPFCWSLVHTIKTRRLVFALGLSVSFMLLLLTLSRGALFGAFVGLIIAFALLIRQWRQVGIVVGSLLGAIVAACLIIFIAGQVNTRDSISGIDTVRRSINQLSLGTLDLPLTVTVNPQTTQGSSATSSSASPTGYIAASTDSRLSMTSEALGLWRSSPHTVLFGLGAGGFGAALHAKNPLFPVGSVVNNYYVEMLAELGVVGFGLFITFLTLLFTQIIKHRQWLLLTVLGALLAQMYFFSGNANIIHIWAVIGCILALMANHKHIASRV